MNVSLKLSLGDSEARRPGSGRRTWTPWTTRRWCLESSEGESHGALEEDEETEALKEEKARALGEMDGEGGSEGQAPGEPEEGAITETPVETLG